MTLSIVIPTYNVEKYIAKCLNSCINQDIPDTEYEILVVNDGTKDDSAIIASEIANENPNITIINQENQGLSGARNTGLNSAKGDYVWFVDSDDYIEENCLSRIFGYLKEDLDILQLQYRMVYEDGRPSSLPTCFCFDGVKTGYDVTLNGGLPAPAQFTIFRRLFLLENDLKFVLNIYHEDSEFKPRAVYKAKKIASDKEFCYNYLQRSQGSIMSSFSMKRLRDVIFVNNNLYDFSKNLPSKAKKSFYSYIALNNNSILLGYRNLPKEQKDEAKVLFIENKHLFKCMFFSNVLKYKLEGAVFSLSIRAGLFFHTIIR